MLTETEVHAIRSVRYSRKFSDGGGLYLLVTPRGGRCWRYAYRFARKYKTLALGVYPDVSLDRARSRHGFARNLLALGFDPSALKAAVGKHTFTATMREWETAPCHNLAESCEPDGPRNCRAIRRALCTLVPPDGAHHGS
ncbi:MAG: Arm DNA-binding domain-containing protein [Steroidobacteraceae bacterium]|jgi:hypothetical protein